MIPDLRLHRTRRCRVVFPLVAIVLFQPRRSLAALRIHPRHKQNPLRVRRPDRSIGLRAHIGQTARRSQCSLRLIPGGQIDLRRCSAILREKQHLFPIRRKPAARLPLLPERYLPLPGVLTAPGKWHHPEMIHLRVLLEIDVRHREHHPPAARRDLRIAHPLHPLQVGEGYRVLSRNASRDWSLSPCRRPRPSQHGSQQTRPNRWMRHRASLPPKETRIGVIGEDS